MAINECKVEGNMEGKLVLFAVWKCGRQICWTVSGCETLKCKTSEIMHLTIHIAPFVEC